MKKAMEKFVMQRVQRKYGDMARYKKEFLEKARDTLASANIFPQSSAFQIDVDADVDGMDTVVGSQVDKWVEEGANPGGFLGTFRAYFSYSRSLDPKATREDLLAKFFHKTLQTPVRSHAIHRVEQISKEISAAIVRLESEVARVQGVKDSQTAISQISWSGVPAVTQVAEKTPQEIRTSIEGIISNLEELAKSTCQH